MLTEYTQLLRIRHEAVKAIELANVSGGLHASRGCAWHQHPRASHDTLLGECGACTVLQHCCQGCSVWRAWW